LRRAGPTRHRSGDALRPHLLRHHGPARRQLWYVCAAAGGLWKTTDGGTTFKPIAEHIGSFSMGYVALDPKNPDVVWLGSGEQNSQRSVDFGDGVYKSIDGGATWKHVGLTRSEHISRIRIDPRNTHVVYVAAPGPLWSSGGDRGVYKTTDGGQSWQLSLFIPGHRRPRVGHGPEEPRRALRRLVPTAAAHRHGGQRRAGVGHL